MRPLLCALLLVATIAPARPAAAASCVMDIGPGIPPPPAAPSKLPGFHAAWYGQSGYMRLCPGDMATATLAYYNSGSLGWVAGRLGEAAYLGTWESEPGQDQPSILGGDGQLRSPATAWPRYNRVAQQPAPYVGPGQVAWFQFTVQAPANPGTYRLYVRPLIEGATWLEDIGVFWQVLVLNADGTLPKPTPPDPRGTRFHIDAGVTAPDIALVPQGVQHASAHLDAFADGVIPQANLDVFTKRQLRTATQQATLQSLEVSWPAAANPFAVSYLAVDRLLATKGLLAIRDWCGRVGAGQDWRQAFAAAFGESTASFYSRFEAFRADYVRSP